MYLRIHSIAARKFDSLRRVSSAEYVSNVSFDVH